MLDFQDCWMWDSRINVWQLLDQGAVNQPVFSTLSVVITPDAYLVAYAGSSVQQIVLEFELGCPLGTASADFETEPCLLCDVGTYSPAAGVTECYQCPGVGTTNSTGAEDVFACNTW